MRLGVFAVAALSISLLATQLHAHIPRPRVCVGIVESIERSTRTVTIRLPDSSSPLKLAWDRQTQFWQNGAEVQPDSLTVGTRVRVAYHHPIFGKMFASSLSWQRP